MKSARYPVLAAPHEAEIEILKSRFIARLHPATSTQEAQAFITSCREAYADATHNCWAFAVGPPGDSGQVGCSDDGEPHGTAGRPMLNVLLHGDVGELVAVVTRYYGGTKLGKGGLVRAYGGAVQEALQSATTRPKVLWVSYAIEADYAQQGAIERVLEPFEVEVDSVDYAEQVSFRFRVAEDEQDSLRKALEEATRGQVILKDP